MLLISFGLDRLVLSCVKWK